jgi:hypothetical protein
MEMHPKAYQPYAVVHEGRAIPYVQHRQIFSLNPCLIPARTLRMGWPAGNEAEFTMHCLADDKVFAFYGKREDAPRVEHVGVERGTGWKL